MKYLTFKIIIKKIIKSQWKISDTISIFHSLLFHTSNAFISRSIKTIIKGKIKCNGLLWFGISSNKMGLDYNSRGTLQISKNGLFETNDNVRIARGVMIHVNGTLTINKNTYIQPNTLILANHKISIGENCAISWNCSILDDDLHSIVQENKVQKNSEISIGNHVWIGCNTTILKGVKIGDNCVIGTGSIVTKSFPSNVLIAGSPAKIIKENISWN